jgi:hypothetical protein
MEPLQEQVAEVITEVVEANIYMEQTHTECAGLINNEIAVQTVDTLKEKNAQAQMQAVKLREKFQAITREVDEAHKG